MFLDVIGEGHQKVDSGLQTVIHGTPSGLIVPPGVIEGEKIVGGLNGSGAFIDRLLKEIRGDALGVEPPTFGDLLELIVEGVLISKFSVGLGDADLVGNPGDVECGALHGDDVLGLQAVGHLGEEMQTRVETVFSVAASSLVVQSVALELKEVVEYLA